MTEKQSWELTKEAWDSFKTLLDNDPERAGQRYEMLRIRLISAFRSRQCLPPDYWADETINRVIRKSQEEHIQNIEFFALGVARRVASEVHRMPILDTAGDATPAPATDADLQEARERSMCCLEKCLQRLQSGDQRLIIEYYGYERSRKARNRRGIAADFGINAGALRVRAFRIRERLAHCVRDCIGSGGMM